MNNATRNAARSLALLSLTLLVSCKAPGEAKKTNDLDAPPAKTTALSVSTTEVKTGKLTVNRSVSATVTAERDSRVATNAGGTVRQVLVSEGRSVNAGQAVLQLDEALEEHNAALPRLQEFILPAGSRAASLAHVCRTVARRAERAVLSVAAAEPINAAPRSRRARSGP